MFSNKKDNMYCPNCKTYFDEGNFCLKCGTKLVENPTTGLNIGDGNAFNGSITYDASHHVQTTNNITQVAAQKTEMELVQEKKAQYLDACRKAYEDNVLDQNEVNLLERYRVELGLSRDEADKMLNLAAMQSQQSMQRQELTSIARIKLKQFSDAMKANDIATLQRQLDSIGTLADKFANEELQFTYHLILSALKPTECISKYESTRADNYWQMYWGCLAYRKRGDKSKSDDILWSLDEKFPNYPADNLALLAVACAFLGGEIQEAKAYLQELAGDHSPVLNGLAECIYLILEPDTAAAIGATEHSCLFYFTQIFEQETAEEKARRKAEEEEAKRKAEEEEAKRKAEAEAAAKKRRKYEVIDGIGYIPYGATCIKKEVFKDNEDLVEINIPDGVTCIEEGAFEDCSNLESITIPDSVTKIGENAFSACSISELILPESLTEIGNGAFEWCGCLTSIIIPENVTEIGEGAFSFCDSIESIEVDLLNPVYESPDDCNAIIHIESDTLISGCKNTIIPEWVTKIGAHAFEGCSSLESITIPDSVTEIGERAFEDCSSLESITIPDSVTEIGSNAFSGCRSLESITIPDSVTEIGNWAFHGCSSLESITIPDSVTEIGDNAFWGCSSLKSISIPPSVTKIGWTTFYRCSSLTSISIPPSVTMIGMYAFQGCSSLTTVRVSKKTKIADDAFKGCPNVKIERY